MLQLLLNGWALKKSLPYLQVLERAKEGESLEELRARTAAQFVDESTSFQNPTKLSLKRKQLDI